MADKTLIGWTDATWNIITGCSMVTAGCSNCYAMGLAGSRLRNHPSRAGLTRETGGRPVWTGEVRFNEEWLDQPLRWRNPRRIFVCAHGDLFHEAVPDEWIDRVFAVMALCPQHTFPVLTKRPERMRKYLSYSARWVTVLPTELLAKGTEAAHRDHWPLPNVWLGTSIEDQATADARIPHLLATPAAIRFASAEPLLGALDLRKSIGGTLWIGGQRGCGGQHQHGGRKGAEIHGIIHDDDPRIMYHHHDDRCGRGIDLVIIGGESGPRARPMHPDWVRSLRDQCVAAGVAFHFKQWGEWELALDRDRDDPDWRCDYSNNYIDCGKSRGLNFAGGRGFHGDRFCVMRRVGTARAGRLLDGRTWDEMPGVHDG